MPAALLATKLVIPPPRPGLVSRSQLLARLDAGLDRRLTLVSAPAGTGKTTLLSHWLAHIKEAPGGTAPHLGWLALDAADGDLARFLAYLVAALPAGRTLLPLLNGPQPPDAESFLTLLINDLAAHGERTVLVLDDYHTIGAPAVHEALAFLLEHKPSSLHVVVAGRIDPPLPLARWRARAELSELRAADLRFSTVEAGEFLHRLIGSEVTPAQVDGLNSRVEGWAAGLQLAGLSGRGRDGEALDRFIAGFSGRQHFVFDYLAGEVLGRQPQELQAFLLATAVPDRLCAGLAEALLAPQVASGAPAASGRPAQAIIEELEHRNLFLAPLDDSQHWYRYHGLFRDLLLARLAEGGPEHVAELHRRAARWFAANGLRVEAVEHGLAARDHDYVVEVIEQAYRTPAGWTDITYATLLGWIAELPPQVVQGRWLLRLLAIRMRYVRGETQAATEQLDALEQELRDGPDTAEARQVLALIPADRVSYALLRGELRTAIAFGRAMLERLPEADHVGRARAWAVVGMAELRGGDVIGADASFAAAAGEAGRSIVPSVAVPFVCSQAEARLIRGCLHAAHRLNTEGLELGRHGDRLLPVAGFAHVGLAKVLYEWNELPAALEHAEHGIALLSEGGITEAFGNGYGVLALIRQAAGDSPGAERTAEMAVHLARASGLPRPISEAGAHRARIWLAQGRVDRAAVWPDELAGLHAGETLQEFEQLTVARILLARGQPAAALTLLDRLAPAAVEASRHGRALEATILRSLALAALGKGREALAALEAALRQAEGEGYVRTFLDMGPAILPLLQGLAASSDVGAYAGRLLAAGGIPSPTATPAPSAEAIELPSERERQVLRLLATDLTVPEIAERLVIAPSTVRSHVKHLYETLGVHGRLEAVLRARELGWLANAKAIGEQHRSE